MIQKKNCKQSKINSKYLIIDIKILYDKNNVLNQKLKI